MNAAMPDRLKTLSNIPLFSYLTPEELQKVQALFVEKVFQKGDVICEVGEPGNTFYVILDGELEVWGGGSGTDRVLLSRLTSGAFFGELALVLGGPRSATVMVSHRATLLELSKESFDQFFLSNTKVLEYFSRVICQRLAASASGQHVSAGTKVIGVVGRPGLRGKSTISAAIAGLLKSYSKKKILLGHVYPSDTEHVEGPFVRAHETDASQERVKAALRQSDGQPAELYIGVENLSSAEQCGEDFSVLLSKLRNDFDYMVLDLGLETQIMDDAVPLFSDMLVRLVDKPEHQVEQSGIAVYEVINLANRSSKPISINSCEPFVIPKDAALARKVADWAALTSPASLPLKRLARKILGKTVGLALGGGAAFGLSHLGVVKVLEDNAIPVDILAGCSFGSLVAVGYASGYRADKLIEMAADLCRTSKLIRAVDLTISKPGFLAGDAIKRIFTPFLRVGTTFDRLQIPCRAIATDIETGERIDIGHGALPEAFRASCSVPVVLSPVRHLERVLVDGGVCDPVPAEIVREMGADICIAVNVVPAPKKGVEMMLSKAFRQMNRLNPITYLGGSTDMPNMLDVTMNALQILQHELGNFKAISADVRINPDLSDFTWVDFHRYEELIAKGAEATTNALPAIKRAVGV